ncbi:MAG: gliding motility-associated C-terminal domain-containing protein [Bacteroidetes bacterium]|nr:gliding motility-associated C-terminal domain-containing protein [Bacteroidota bacterium]
MSKKIIILITLVFSIISINAQRGKDGAKVVTGTEVVNAYTFLTLDITAGDTSITVDNSSLNTNFSGNITAGDLIMIIQVQGVSIIDMAHPGQTIDWGRITNYNNCGNYEFVEIKNVPNSTTLISTCGLTNNYTASDKVVIVRVPRYSTLAVNSGGVLTADAWNGNTGGILAIEVLDTTTIDGNIDVSSLGFRGGQIKTTSGYGGLRYADANPLEGAEKGEGIAGSQADYDSKFNGRYGRGAAANAGGGGNGHNSGGAGGANGGNINIWNKGLGNPDVSTANYITAWGLDTGIISINPNPTLVVSSGGGRGGYSHCASNQNELTLAPNNPNWGGDYRRDNGGLGGRPLDYSTNKIFMAGAGGAGEANDIYGGNGGNGAGIVYLKSYNSVTGTGSIDANGENGGNCSGPSSPGFGQYSGKDAAGGGGAGGSIIIETTGSISGVAINANGGSGGNQIMTTGPIATIQEAEGPGGGGGGGYVAISNGTPTININGGINGTTNSPLIANFPPNGATKGGLGSTGTITSFDLVANDETICPNTTATLTASISGTTPVGATIEWYDAEFGGNLLQTGNSFTTPVLAVQTTYYVKICPGTFSVPVTVFIDVCGIPPIPSFSSSDSTICAGSCINFNDLSTNTPSGWSWYFFGSDTPNSSNQNPTNICYSAAGTFDVALVVSNPSGSDSLFMADFITVNALPNVIANANDTSICIGDTLILNGGGATSYTWDNGVINNIGFVPSTTTLYTVTGIDTVTSCQNTDTLTVFVNALPNVIANATDTIICLGDSVKLYGSGATSYLWNFGVTDSINFSPASTNTYTVTGTDINGCNNTDSIKITVGVCGLPPVSSFSASDSSICIGSCISFTDLSANLPTSWTWYFFGSDSLNSSNQNPSNICYNTVGTFDVSLVTSNANGGPDSLFIPNFITVNALPTITANTDTAICLGSNVNLSANGAVSYVWDNGLGNGQTHSPTPTVFTTYSVTGTDTNGCINTAQVNVDINALPIIITSDNDTAICIGDTVKLRADGAFTYLWDNGLGNIQNPNATPTVQTFYTVIGTDTNGCSSSATVEVNIYGLPNIVASNDDTICSGDTITISASGGFAYSWDNGLSPTPSINPNEIVFPTITTTYTVTAADMNGCRNTDQVTVSVISCNPPIANLIASDTLICINDCIDFTDLTTNSPTNWTWYFFGSNTVNSNNQNPTNICYNSVGSFDVALFVSNAFGSDTLFFANYITVDSCIIPSVPPIVTPVVVVPNIFSPNGDGQNDLFKVDGIAIKNVSMKIYNRWGQIVYEASQTNTGWNGRTNSGNEVPDGTYFYVIDVETTEKTETFTGTLTLVR